MRAAAYVADAPDATTDARERTQKQMMLPKRLQPNLIP
jgi:hypothetical protein